VDAKAQDVLSGRAAWSVECAEVVEGLRRLPAGCVQCVCMSPPYLAVRDYKVPPTDWPAVDYAPLPGAPAVAVPAMTCCLGLEPDPLAYVAHLLLVMREVRRVLRPDGTAWVNCGDSFGGYVGRNDAGKDIGGRGGNRAGSGNPGGGRSRQLPEGFRGKNLLGVPWRVAFALQADGWYLRAAITWCKVSPMPESCRDRVTRATEMVFMLTKKPAYFYDQEAERVANTPGTLARLASGPMQAIGAQPKARACRDDRRHGGYAVADGRNLWDYWTDIRPSPGDFQHYAAFPPDLPRRCLRLGTSEKGACPACGAPWVREVEYGHPGASRSRNGRGDLRMKCPSGKAIGSDTRGMPSCRVTDLGWQPSCACPPADPIPCLCLDPFAGSGTTGMVARRLGRRFVGFDLNPEYVSLSRKRIASDAPLFNAAPATPPPAPGLFDALIPEAP
jgi:DNA modification methylase